MPWAAAAVVAGAVITGAMASSKGEGSSSETSSSFDRTNVYDDVASEKALAVGGKLEAWGDQQWEDWNRFFKGYELDAVMSNRQLLPYITGYSKEAFKQLKKTTTDFHTMAREGIDTSGRMDEAEAGVVGAFDKIPQAMRIEAARYGIDPSSRRFQDSLRRMGIDEAKAIAGARTKAKTGAEAEQFSRLALASGREPTNTGLMPVADKGGQAATLYGMAAGSYQPLANRVLEVSQQGKGEYTDRSNVWDYVGDMAGSIGGYVAGQANWAGDSPGTSGGPSDGEGPTPGGH